MPKFSVGSNRVPLRTREEPEEKQNQRLVNETIVLEGLRVARIFDTVGYNSLSPKDTLGSVDIELPSYGGHHIKLELGLGIDRWRKVAYDDQGQPKPTRAWRPQTPLTGAPASVHAAIKAYKSSLGGFAHNYVPTTTVKSSVLRPSTPVRDLGDTGSVRTNYGHEDRNFCNAALHIAACLRLAEDSLDGLLPENPLLDATRGLPAPDIADVIYANFPRIDKA